MNAERNTLTSSAPKMIPAITAGFDVVANNLQLILPPVLLDLLLWFGPHLRLDLLLNNILQRSIAGASSLGSTDLVTSMQANQKMLEETWSQFNMLVLLRTFPVGVTSLFFGKPAWQTPLGAPINIELTRSSTALLILIVLTLVGILAGSIYFSAVARYTTPFNSPRLKKESRLVWQTGQVLLANLVIILLLMLAFIPASLLLSLSTLLSPNLSQFVIMLIAFLLLWMALPLIFAMHGIFAYDLQAITSALTSIRLIRFYLPGAGLFLLLALLVNEGMNVIWRIPEPSSWLALLGVLGHAFISTALLAASFVYYRDGTRFMQENIQRMAEKLGGAV